MLDPNIKLLLVEDNPSDVLLLTEYFRLAGGNPQNITQVKSIKTAQAVLKADQFDIILLDLTLPDGQGERSFGSIHHFAGSTPIVILTGLDDSEAATRMVQAGAQDYLPKNRMNEDNLPRIISFAIERKRAEIALKVERDRIQQYLDIAAVIFLVLAPDGSVRLINQKGAQILGYPQDQIVGKNWFQHFIPEDNRSQVGRVFKQLVSGEIEASDYFENSVLTRNGERRIIAWHNTFLNDQQGMISGVLSSGEDITERVQAVEALRESEALLNQAQQVAHVGSWVWQIQTNQLAWSDEMFHIFGINKETFTGELSTVINQAIHPDDREKVENSNLSVITNKKPIPVEYRIIRSDGSERTVWAEAGELILDESGNPMRLTGIVQDITERKQAEEALQLQLEFLNTLIDTIPNPIFYKDRDGKYTGCNIAFETFIGMPKEEIIGKTVYDLGSKEIADQYFEHDQQLFRNPGKQVYEWKVKSKAGEIRNVIFNKGTFKDPDGQVRGLVGAISDITERIQAEEKLRKYSENLEELVEERTLELRDAQDKLLRQERLAALGQLAGGVGHELRNPLAIISNAIYFLKLILPDENEKIKEYLHIIEHETQNTEKIITDLLEFSRTKSIDRKPVSVEQIVKNTLERYPAPERIAVSLDLPSDLPLVYVDPLHIVQVLGNLVTNAYQAMSDGGELSIQSSVIGKHLSKDSDTLTTDHDLLLTVCDTGVGIPPENLEKIFEPLFTTKAKGIGLGLAVSQKLVEANEGRIEVESDLGKGTRFMLYLPVTSEIE